jgi:hypothetical protein
VDDSKSSPLSGLDAATVEACAREAEKGPYNYRYEPSAVAARIRALATPPGQADDWARSAKCAESHAAGRECDYPRCYCHTSRPLPQGRPNHEHDSASPAQSANARGRRVDSNADQTRPVGAAVSAAETPASPRADEAMSDERTWRSDGYIGNRERGAHVAEIWEGRYAGKGLLAAWDGGVFRRGRRYFSSVRAARQEAERWLSTRAPGQTKGPR